MRRYVGVATPQSPGNAVCHEILAETQEKAEDLLKKRYPKAKAWMVLVPEVDFLL